MGIGITISLIAAGVSFYMGFKFIGVAVLVFLIKKLIANK